MLAVRTLNRQDAWDMWQEGFPEDQEAFFRLFWEKRSADRISLGLYDGARPVCALHLIPQKILVRGAKTDAVMVAGVSTRRDERHRGYASYLMREAENTIRGMRIPLAFLDPFLEDFYRPFGYETGTWYRDVVFDTEGDASLLSKETSVDVLDAAYRERTKESGVCVLRSSSDWAFRISDLTLENGAVWKDNRDNSYLMLTEEEEQVRIFEHQTAPERLKDVMEAVCALYHKPVLCPVAAQAGEKGLRHGAMFAPVDIRTLIRMIPHEEGNVCFRLQTGEETLSVQITGQNAAFEETKEEAQITSQQLLLLMLGAESTIRKKDDPVLRTLDRIYPAKKSVLWEQY